MWQGFSMQQRLSLKAGWVRGLGDSASTHPLNGLSSVLRQQPHSAPSPIPPCSPASSSRGTVVTWAWVHIHIMLLSTSSHSRSCWKWPRSLHPDDENSEAIRDVLLNFGPRHGHSDHCRDPGRGLRFLCCMERFEASLARCLITSCICRKE